MGLFFESEGITMRIKRKEIVKKIGIVTITNSGMNFGNRLQNYALQEKLKEYGVQPETIYSSNVCGNSLLLSGIRRIIKIIVKRSKRRRFFNKFDKKYIDKAKIVRYGRLNDRSLSNKYAAFITGSDQVWNPNYHFNSEFEFLRFTEKKKRYSYAASFGVDEIADIYKENYGKWIKEMHKVSVREESGSKLIKELTGRVVPVHVDPCMLLTIKDYKRIEEKPSSSLPKRYLLTYLLGNKLSEYRIFIKEMAESLGLEIVELSEGSRSSFYHIGPQHFVYLFRHAEYICTDSFHGTVCSILFEKRFTVFFRKDKDVPTNARIKTLLNKMQLYNRLFGELTAEESIKAIDYYEVNELLENERRKTEDYFKTISELW